ncbi:hypothetical protein EJ08DRAFT_667816 [Tothia fuscella]|uniref:Uncharacterized protein n=1 Tax=Tothia fuscella TaxID=1048955 RepID=A0A9P4P3I1_9PEZI|nr:hypothetical protein EJ08DRAFT_667816 [Tothia fuscella]
MPSPKEANSPSSQLYSSLHETLTRTLSIRRPILHHLNADSTWLLQIPRPPLATARGGRIYYNILIDPWLKGGQSDVAKWFSQQWHSYESAVGSIADVEELIWGIEEAAGGGRDGERGRRDDGVGDSCIDVVAVCHEFTDHCHRETLEEVGRDVPVFATKKAADLIRSWNHFRTVYEIPPFIGNGTDWRATSIPPLPEYISISRIVAQSDAFYYHSALVFTFDTHQKASNLAKAPRRSNGHSLPDPPEADPITECVIYTPHGVKPEALLPLQNASPPIKTLCFIHGLHDVSISWGQQLNLGVHNGLQAQRRLKSKYWVGTHDEVKKGGGLVGWFLQRKVLTVEQALKEEEAKLNRVEGEKSVAKVDDARFMDIGNGQSIFLE